MKSNSLFDRASTFRTVLTTAIRSLKWAINNDDSGIKRLIIDFDSLPLGDDPPVAKMRYEREAFRAGRSPFVKVDVPIRLAEKMGGDYGRQLLLTLADMIHQSTGQMRPRWAELGRYQKCYQHIYLTDYEFHGDGAIEKASAKMRVDDMLGDAYYLEFEMEFGAVGERHISDHFRATLIIKTGP